MSEQEPNSEVVEQGTATSERDASLLVQEGDAAADYLEGFLDILDLDGDIDIDVEGNRAMVSIIEANAGELQSLVGTDGAVLNALQELTRLAATQATGERSRLMLDIAGYRAARRLALQELAAEAMSQVRSSGEPVALEPMTAFERKVVHDAVAAAGMASASEGEEPRRYIVISAAGPAA
ncbi:MAG: protein jag [Actinomycetales bacterium]